MLNPNLDLDALAQQYATDHRVRVDNLLQQDVADRMREICLQHVPYDYLTYTNGENRTLSQAAMQQLDNQAAMALQDAIFAAAMGGVGFLYCGYMFGRDRKPVNNPPLEFLFDVFRYFNGKELRSAMSRICGRDDLDFASGQFTRYTAGHFLTRHSDDTAHEQRRVAYVLSLTTGWHPDWGGLLQFFEPDGSPRDAWLPRFNSLALFDTRHIHSVTYVTPYAQQPRLSMTGWFQSGKPA